MSILIPRRVLAEIIYHALQDDPNECCGLMLGTATRIDYSRRTVNVHDNKINRYMVSPHDLLEVQSEADKRKSEIVGIYHSHTYTQAYPSETDVRNAVESGWTDPFHIIVSLVEKTRPVVRAFHIGADGVVKEKVITTDGKMYRGSSV